MEGDLTNCAKPKVKAQKDEFSKTWKNWRKLENCEHNFARLET